MPHWRRWPDNVQGPIAMSRKATQRKPNWSVTVGGQHSFDVYADDADDVKRTAATFVRWDLEHRELAGPVDVAATHVKTGETVTLTVKATIRSQATPQPEVVS